MIDLYALTSPNVQKIYIMLEECGLPYKEHFVDVWKGEQYKPEFSKVNPNNKIPAIVDHDGPGGKPLTVIESGAILLYLAEKTGKFLPKDAAKKYEVIQWLMIQLTGVGPMFGQWTHFKLFAPKGDNDYSMARYTSEIKRLYEVLEKRLGEVPYLGGQDYSIADIATFPWTRNHDAQGVKWEDNPRALVQRHQRAPRGEGGAGQDRRHQVEPRDRIGRRQGPLLQPRPLRPGVIAADRLAGAGRGRWNSQAKPPSSPARARTTASAPSARKSSPRAAAAWW
jgi:GSH-dependent disulfide-bond oxidoreductase